MKNTSLLIYIILITLLTNCLSTAKLESAKTLGKGNSKYDSQISYFGFENKKDRFYFFDALPFTEIGYQKGYKENLDLRFYLNSSLSIGVDGKYQLTKGKSNRFNTAIGLGLQHTIGIFYASENPSNNTASVSMSTVVYNSFHFSPKLFTFINPHYHFQSIYKGNKFTNQYLGGSIGMGFQYKTHELTLGYTFDNAFRKNDKSIGKIMQFGIKYALIKTKEKSKLTLI